MGDEREIRPEQQERNEFLFLKKINNNYYYYGEIMNQTLFTAFSDLNALDKAIYLTTN